MGRLRKLSLGAAGLVAALAAALAWAVLRQVPGLDAPRIPELSAPVQVGLDARGIPTIRAASLADAFRAQGYLAARDRLFQMEVHRRMAQGRLAEAFGQGALPVDRIHRIYGFRDVAREAASRLPPAERADLDAFCEGVNAFIRQRPGRWGLEFQVLGLRPEAWTPADCLEGLLLMHESMSTTWRWELRGEALEGLPEAVRRFLRPAVTERDELLAPDGDPPPRPDTAFRFEPPPPGRKAPRAEEEAPEAAASNNWAVAGWRSKSGRPMLANDPHLGLTMPGMWLAVRFEVQGRSWQGAALPFLPGIVLGMSDRIAWGFTNLGTDVQDLYREKPVRTRFERIEVRGRAPENLPVALGRHGPQVEPGLSLCWSALDPGLLRVPIRALMEAGDWDAFNRALDGWSGPAQNVVFASASGHIGWRASGVVPLRAPGEDGSRILDGSDPAKDWRGYLAASALPRVLDPPQGVLATANQRVIGTSFPHPVATRWAPPTRARRILDRILGAGRLDRDGMEAIQLDTVSTEHREFMALALPYLDDAARSLFKGWDGDAQARSTRFALADRFRADFRKLLLARLTGAQEGRGLADFDPADALRAGPGAWLKAGPGEPEAMLRLAWKQAQDGPATWGEANRLEIRHPFGRAGGLLAWIFDPPSRPQGGAHAAVRVAAPHFGQSLRFIVDWGDPLAATLVLPLGESGHLGSTHRLDQMDAWMKGDPGGVKTRLSAPAVARMEFRP